MRFRSVRLALFPAFASILLLALVAAPGVAQERPLELTDLMRFRTLHDPVISDDGSWVAYESRPDRGDGEVLVRSTDGEAVYRIERGSAPRISSDAGWVGALVKPPLEEVVKAEKGSKKNGGDDDGPKTGFALLATADGSVTSYERVKSFAFSEDGRWVVIHRFPPDEGADGAEDRDEPGEERGGPEPVPEPETEIPPEPMPPRPEEQTGEGEEAAEPEDERVGSPLVLRELVTGREVEIPYVEHYAFDEPADHLAFAVAAPGGEGNGLYLRPLVQGAGDSQPPEQALHRAERGRYSALAWAPERSLLGFVAAVDDEEGEPGEADVWVWGPGPDDPDGPDGPGRPRAARTAATSDGAPEGWFVPSVNELTWSEDGERLFFGFKPRDEAPRDDEAEGDEEGESEEDESEKKPFDPYDVDAILEERTVDVWHWNDPLIIPNQKERWDEEKDRTYLAVWHREADRVVPLAGREMREVAPVDNPRAVLGLADVPYLREITWDGWYRDVYRVDLENGSRQLVAERLEEEASLSPGGRYVAYYRSPHWYLFDGDTGAARNLTEGLGVPFADEDHDYPGPAPGYGVADWVSRDGEDTAVLIYDKYDVWQLPTDPAGGEPIRLTDGRGDERIFRVVDPDPEKDERLDHVEPGERLLLTGYHDREKHRGLFAARVGESARTGLRELVDEPGKTYDPGPRAEEAERILFTRESYTEFPDLWVADLELDQRLELSDANPQIDRFAWGESELVEWTSPDGEPLQGVLIKPAGYREGERVPVLVYFYRTYSYRVHRFNEPVVNHRPSFPYYASRGYAVFLPDIRFEVGRPGLAATKCLVSAVQHLVEMGVADPDAVGLQGHSWAGYQAAFVITQTDLFAAAAAGAPVSNMTSAYGGIRWGTGLARQFQYEQSQSRLGASLWEARDRYIENSPLFYADRIETPLLIEFGDEDGAVPWTQGIELYLAMRRLGKEAFFLQYRGEPHHLTRYGNKLDYSIKMREFFDHYLKGEPAPEWMTEGVPYRGE
ncbi:MAG: prolyl oligopeptidase family serine peptidase [Acidobacteriota bacterium]|jgi:dipeptidyl aminopeptidase/acylaminoacyl peptidase